MTAEPPKRRRWFQFRLRTLLIATLLLSLPLSWGAVQIRNAKRRKAAEAALEKGCEFEYELAMPWAPDWAYDVLGDDFLWNVVEVESYTIRFDAAEADYLKDLAHVRRLILMCDTQVTDAGLERFAELAELEELFIFGPEVTDSWAEHFRGLASLKDLTIIGDTQLTDAGLAHLGAIASLEELDLCVPEITDAGIEHLKGLKNLRSLALEECRLTDAGLRYLVGLPRLERLNVSYAKITDAGARLLGRMPQLTCLDLDDTEITDEGLRHLQRLTNLRTLDIRDTQVTPEGVQTLQAALPNCKIDYTPPSPKQQRNTTK